MKLSKRILALLLALTMITSNIPVTALASEPSVPAEETIAAETAAEPPTQAPETTSPPTVPAATEAETEAAEETEATQEQETEPAPDEAPSEPEVVETAAASDFAEATEEAADESVEGETPPAFVSYEWLSFDGATGKYYQQDGGRETAYHVRPGDAYYHIYYVNTWNGEGYDATPVHVTSSNSYVTLTPVEELAAEGEPLAQYFYKVEATAWDRSASIYASGYPDAEPLGADTALGIDSFHSSSNCINSTFITNFNVIPGGDNSFYFLLQKDGDYWEITSALNLQSTDIATMEKVSGGASSYTGVYKITLKDTYIQSLANAGEQVFFPVTVTHTVRSSGDPENPNRVQTWTLNMYCAYNPEQTPDSPDDSQEHAPHLTFALLNETENGYEAPGPDGRGNNQYRMLPSEHHMLQFYLNTWNGSEYVAQPTSMQSNENISFTPIEGGDFFYDVEVHCWDNMLELTKTLDDGTVVGGVTIHTNRNESGWYSSETMSNGTWLWEYNVDPDAELQLYVGMDNTYDPGYTPAYEPRINNVPEGYISLTRIHDMLYQVSLSDEAIQELRRGEELRPELDWTGYWSDGSLDTETYTTLTLRMVPEKVVHEPYLSFTWLDYSENGMCQSGIHDNRGYSIRPVDEFFHIYYLNTWNSAKGDYEAEPVHVKCNNGVLNLSQEGFDIAPDQDNAAYFYRVTTDQWNQNTEVFCEYNDQPVVMYVDTFMGEESFHSKLPCDTESYINNIRLDLAAEETVLYFRFGNDDWKVQEIDLADDLAGLGELTSLGDGIYQIKIYHSFLNSTEKTERDIVLDVTLSHVLSGEIRTKDPGIYCHWDSREPYLTHGWLDNHSEGFMEPDNHDGRDFDIRPGDERFMIYYLNYWDEEARTFKSEPVHVTCDDTLALSQDGFDVAAGQVNADYFYKLTTIEWNQHAKLYYEYKGQTLTMSVHTFLGEDSFHDELPCNTDTYISEIALDSTAEENIFYFRFESDYWTITNAALADDLDESLAKLTDLGGGIYQITVFSKFMETTDGDWREVQLKLDLTANDGQVDTRYPGIGCNWADLRPFLTFGWVEETENGLMEGDMHEARDYAIRLPDEFYHIYYLNVWNPETGNFDAEPVQVACDDSAITLSQEDLRIADGEKNGKFFYRVTANEWNQNTEVYCKYNNQRIAMPVNTFIGEDSFHTDLPCDENTYTNHIILDPYKEENVFYFRFESEYWTLKKLSLSDNLDESLAELTDLGGGIYQITVFSKFMETTDGDWRDVRLKLELEDPDGNPDTWEPGVGCHWERHDPYISHGWLQNHGDGFFEEEGHDDTNPIYTPKQNYHHIFYLNLWNSEKERYDSTPVEIFCDSDALELTRIPEEAQKGQTNADYFYRIQAVKWDQDPEIYCFYEDQRYSQTLRTSLGETSFHSGPECSNETFITEFKLDPFAEENVFYFRFVSDYWNVEDHWVPEHLEGLIEMTDLGEGIYQITLSEEFVTSALLNGRDAEIMFFTQSKHDPNHQEPEWLERIYCYYDPGAGYARINIDDEDYMVIDEGKNIRFYPTGDYDEEGNEIWTSELLEALPDGISFDLDSNTLTLEDASYDNIFLFYRSWEVDGEIRATMPSQDLTIELIGDNSLISETGSALNIDNMNVTFKGNGSLDVKSTNNVDTVDDEGYPWCYPSWYMAGGKLILSDDVNVTVEIAGEGEESCWDEHGEFMGQRNAHLNAMFLENTPVTLTGNASLTTIVPDDARDNGPLLGEDEPVFWDDTTPGGYSGIIGFKSINIMGNSTLNTQQLHIDPPWQNDRPTSGSYFQSGGTVNIEALGGKFLAEEYDDQGNLTGELVDHYHYTGMSGSDGSTIHITGGILNIQTAPTAAEHASSSYFHGLQTRGGELKITGGEVNFITAYEGQAFRIESVYDENGEVVEPGLVNITGGTINVSGIGNEVTREIYAVTVMDLTPGSKANFLGGTINTQWSEFWLGGEVVYDGMQINGYGTILSLDGGFTMKSGKITLDSGVIYTNGKVTMTGGQWDLPRTWVMVNNAFLFSGGNIAMDYDGTNPNDLDFRPPALIINSYFNISESAELIIANQAEAPAIEVSGHLQPAGGTITITHTNEDHPAVALVDNPEAGEDGETALFLGDGVISITGPEGKHVFGFLIQDSRNMILADGELKLTNADLISKGVIQVGTDKKQSAKLHVINGHIRLENEGGMLIQDGGAVVLDAVRPENALDWTIAMDAGFEAFLEITGGSLTVNGQNYDCTMDINGSYRQTGGTATIRAFGDGGNLLGMCAKSTFLMEGGTLNASGDTAMQIGCAIGETPEDTVRMISGGTMNLKGITMGIYQESHLDIVGGNVNIDVECVEVQDISEQKFLHGNGILIYTGKSDSDDRVFAGSLSVLGGNLTISMREAPDGYIIDSTGIFAQNSKVELLGGTYRCTNGVPLFSRADSMSGLFTVGDDMAVYSLENGEKLIPITETLWFDANDKLTDDEALCKTKVYVRFYTEGNVDASVTDENPVPWACNTAAVTNKAGKNLRWEVKDGLLTFQGSGEMNDYGAAVSAPWAVLEDHITNAELDSNVTAIGSYAFNGLNELTTLTFLGDAPEFHKNAFAGITADAYYPADKTGWTEDIRLNYGGVVTWHLDVDSVVVSRIDSSAEFLMPYGEATLTAVLSAETANGMNILWTLDKDSEPFAALYADGSEATVIAKNATEKQPIKVSAVLEGSEAEPVQKILYLYPHALEVSICREKYDPDNNLTTYENITDEKIQVDIGRNNTYKLAAFLNPDDVMDVLEQGVEWSSSSKKVATVSQDGTVEFQKTGKVTITAAALDGSGAEASVTLTAVKLPQNIRMDADNVTGLMGGTSAALTAINEDTGKALKSSEIIWSIVEEDSADNYKSYVTLTTAGKLTTKAVLKPMKVTVMAAVKGNEEFARVSQVITVYPAASYVDILDADGQVATGTTLYLDTTNAAEGSLPTLELDALVGLDGAMQGVTWKSSSKKIATVDEETGVVQAVWSKNACKTGSVTITATAKDGSGEKASVKIQIGVFATDVNILTAEETLTAGKSLTLKAETVPEKPTKTGVTWSLKNAEDKQYATLSSSGKLKAKTVYGPTDVTVIAASKDGRAETEYTITIEPKNPDILILKDSEMVNVTKTTILLDANQQETLELLAYNLSTDEDVNAQWKSSKPKIATVEDGVVSPVVNDEGECKTGTVTITATDPNSKKRTASVTVTFARIPSEIIVTEKGGSEDDTLTLASGKTMRMAAELVDSSGQGVTWAVYDQTEDGLTESRYASIASSGKLKANSGLTSAVDVIVEATAKDGSGVTGSTTVRLIPPTTAIQIFDNNTGLEVTNTTLIHDMSEELALSTKVYPIDQDVTWSSSSKKVVMWDEEEETFVLLKPGTTTITATDASGKKASFKLTLVKPVESLKLPKTALIAGGKTLTLEAVVGPDDATNPDLIWTMEGDTAFASLSSGKLKTIAVTAPKTVTVTAATEDGSKQARCHVTIYPATTKVTLWYDGENVSGKTIELGTGTDIDLKALSDPHNAAGNKTDASSAYEWKSSNEEIATVDESGSVQTVMDENGEYKTGTVTITCMAADGTGRKATVKIKYTESE